VSDQPRVLVVTGTGTEIGKTIVTAALACLLRDRGSSVAVVKPIQTGLALGEPGDIEEVRQLVGDDGVDFHEFVRLPDPLAPDAAARLAGVDLPPVSRHADQIELLAASSDVVIVEGAGGLLVRLDRTGGTLADLVIALREKGVSVGVVLVVTASLGTLNHTALTAEALRARDLPLVGVIIGSWPAEPELAATSNLVDLPQIADAPLLGRIPEGVGALAPKQFRLQAHCWLRLA
jgi:dethiobiotin synthetase